MTVGSYVHVFYVFLCVFKVFLTLDGGHCHTGHRL